MTTWSLTFTCDECGTDVPATVVPMFDEPTSTLIVDPRPLHAHGRDEHGTEPVEQPTPPETPPPDVGYDSLVPGALYVPGPGEADPTVGDPLPDPGDEADPNPEEAPA